MEATYGWVLIHKCHVLLSFNWAFFLSVSRGGTMWRRLKGWRIWRVCRFSTCLWTGSTVFLASRIYTTCAPSTWRKTWYCLERTLLKYRFTKFVSLNLECDWINLRDIAFIVYIALLLYNVYYRILRFCFRSEKFKSADTFMIFPYWGTSNCRETLCRYPHPFLTTLTTLKTFALLSYMAHECNL